jgi:chromosome segregation ATPase
MRILGSLLIVITMGLSAQGQATSPEAQQLQALVNEVRQLRQELRTVTVASQRVQIVLYRLQAQEAAMQHASQQLSDARARLSNAEGRVQEFGAEVKMLEDQQTRAVNPADRAAADDTLTRMRSRLEEARKNQASAQTAVTDAENQLRREQQQLTELQGFLDQLDSVLNGLAQPAAHP